MTAGPEKNKSPLPLEEMMQAIPDEITNAPESQDPLGDLISQINTRKAPVNSLSRLWVLGGMQAKIAVGYIAYALKSSFSNRTEKQRLLNETHLKAALKL